jgi:predicted transcriptional regulator YdeE
MDYKEESLDEFLVIGISARVDMHTAAERIGALWKRWFQEGLEAKIPTKASTDIYSIYTNYEGDHTKPYTCFLGCRVDSISIVPDKMQALEVTGGKYAVFDVHGKLPEVIVQTWNNIYQIDSFERRWDVDFDLYGAEAMNPDNAKLNTFVSLK